MAQLEPKTECSAGPIWSEMKTYVYIKRYYVLEVMLTGLIAIGALVICPLLALNGFMPGIMIVLIVPSVYQIWNTFVAIANPETVTIDDEFIEFGGWGRTDKYLWSEINDFRVREFPTAGKMYIRINGGGLFRGRYWLQTRVMSDGKELFRRMCDIEYSMHPNSLKARARRTNSAFMRKDE